MPIGRPQGRRARTATMNLRLRSSSPAPANTSIPAASTSVSQTPSRPVHLCVLAANLLHRSVRSEPAGDDGNKRALLMRVPGRTRTLPGQCSLRVTHRGSRARPAHPQRRDVDGTSRGAQLVGVLRVVRTRGGRWTGGCRSRGRHRNDHHRGSLRPNAEWHKHVRDGGADRREGEGKEASHGMT